MAETETATTMDDENTTTTTNNNNNTTTKPDIDVNKKEKYASYPQHQPTRLYLVICNIQKIANIKNMLLASIAFGCSEVLLVGNLQRTKKTTTTKKTKDDDDDDDDDDQIVFTNNKMFPVQFQEAVAKGIINLRHFPKWKQCVHYMNCPNSNRRKIYLIGVEIDEARSQLLDTNYYHQHYPKNETDIGILLGNEGQGILGKCNFNE